MIKIRELRIKCSIEGHDYVELACLNQSCKANRVYCHQCFRNGDHIAHIRDQKNINELIEFFQQIDQESEGLVSKLSMMVEKINELFSQLILGLKKKYQCFKERLFQLNAIKLNQALYQMIKYDEIKTCLLEDDIILQLKRKIIELKLHLKDQKIEIVFNEPQRKQTILNQTKKNQIMQKNYIEKDSNYSFSLNQINHILRL